MLALAAHPLGIRPVVFAARADEPAAEVCDVELGGWDDMDALDRFAARVDVATYEFENIPQPAVRRIAQGALVAPGIDALRYASDRLQEKTLFRTLGIETARFAPVDSQADLVRAATEVGLPAVLKTRRLGYDGKGQKQLRHAQELDGAFAELGHVPCILESLVPFDRELSVIAVRSADGQIESYPLFENRHRRGVLRTSIGPALATDAIIAEAQRAIGLVLSQLEYVGVLALELFQRGDALLANELAPRVHNTGHLTIEGSETSQFENHLRALVGYPLGSVAPRGPAAMVNLIGERPDFARLLAIPHVHLHWYGKEPRPGRKLGHVTIRVDDPSRRDALLEEVESILASGD